MVTVLAIFALANEQTAEAHPNVHPQKKLFAGRWYKPGVDLTTSPPWFLCDGNESACANKWISPAYNALAEWNLQPSTARFVLQPDQNPNHDVNVVIVDSFGPPGLLGIALFYDVQGNECSPYFPPEPGTSYCATD
jgi:hypothetical protein